MGGHIQVKDLSLSFHWKSFTKQIFSDLNLTIEPGSFVTIFGRNGSGKSSLIKLFIGLITPDQGSVEVEGKRVVPGYPTDVKEGRIAYLSQQIEELFFADTVAEELTYGSTAIELEHNSVLQDLELENLLGHSIETLSGGERQALALAQFMLQPAPILLLDEPSSYLDGGRAKILKHYLAEAHDQGKTIIHVTQYPSEILWGTHKLDLDQEHPKVVTQ